MVFDKILPLPNNLLPDFSSVLLIGKDGTCKTSFLFRFCHSIADQFTDRVVIYISPIKLFKMPLSVEGMNPMSSETAQRVTIFYPTCLDDLVEYLSRFFTLGLLPCAFIVDDLDYIIKRKRIKNDKTYSQALSHVFALLIDNVEHCKSISGQSCQLIAATGFDTTTNDELIITKSIGELFFEEVFTIDDHQLLGTTTKGFAMISKDKTFKIIVQIENGLIKLKQVLKKNDQQKKERKLID